MHSLIFSIILSPSTIIDEGDEDGDDMTSSKTALKPTEKTYRLLYAKSGNRCAYPKCSTPITLNRTLVGEVAHIKAESPDGPRYDATQSDDERRSYENVLLLCRVHHKVVDDDEKAYTVERLQAMKETHEAQATSLTQGEIDSAVGLLMEQTVVQSASHGIINIAPNYGDQKVVDNRQYGVPKPPPNIVGLRTELLPPIPKPKMPEFSQDTSPFDRQRQMREYRMLTIGQSQNGPTWNPGIELYFHVDAQFQNPMFAVHCDHPCIGERIMFDSGGISRFAGTYPFFSTNDPTVVVVGSGDMRFLTPDVQVVITLRSQDYQPINSATVETYAP